MSKPNVWQKIIQNHHGKPKNKKAKKFLSKVKPVSRSGAAFFNTSLDISNIIAQYKTIQNEQEITK